MARERVESTALEGREPDVADPNVAEEVGVVRAERERLSQARERFVFGAAVGKMLLKDLDPAYHYHWANDYPGRIDLFMASGYEFVKPGEVSFQTPGVTPRNSEVGDKVSMIVGRVENEKPLRAYLMKKPMDWFLEDQRKGQERPDAIEEAIRNGRVTADTSDSRHFYQPKGAPIKLSSDFRKRTLED